MDKYKAVYMRGGTSKGIFFKKEDLPDNRDLWDEIFLKAMGNPDPKQIDGMGGTVSSNNKIMIVWKSNKDDVDIEYLVGQVIVGENRIDYKANCGNMTAAVGPFAVEEKMVEIIEPITKVRLLNINTDKKIDAYVPIKDGSFNNYGDTKIGGIDGTSAEIKLSFLNPSGSITGKLFPTDNKIDKIKTKDLGEIETTIIDVSNPLVIIRGEDIGLNGKETPEDINENKKICDLLEEIRGKAGILINQEKTLEDMYNNSPGIPKIAIFTKPLDYKKISKRDMDFNTRVMSIFKCHKACPLSSANALAVSSLIEGTIINKDLKLKDKEKIRIGNPSGIMEIYPKINGNTVESVSVIRTARRIMDGYLYIKKG